MFLLNMFNLSCLFFCIWSIVIITVLTVVCFNNTMCPILVSICTDCSHRLHFLAFLHPWWILVVSGLMNFTFLEVGYICISIKILAVWTGRAYMLPVTPFYLEPVIVLCSFPQYKTFSKVLDFWKSRMINNHNLLLCLF